MAERDVGAIRRLLELFALTAFALAQPLLDVTGRSPDFFLHRQPTGNQMRVLLLLVVLGPPLGLWLVEQVLGLVGPPAARAAHLAFMGVLVGVLVVQLGKQSGLLTGIPLALVAAAGGAGVAVLLTRRRSVRRVVAYASPAPIVFALVFTLTSASGALVRPHGSYGSAAAVGAGRPPVVFLFLDEFPLRSLLDGKGEVAAGLFPNFARLARGSTWFPNATGVSGETPFAAPAMLSGRFPTESVAPSYLEYPENLFTLLGGSYDIRAFETVSQLCPPRVCTAVPAGRATGLRPLLKDMTRLGREIVSPYPARSNPTEQFVEATIGDARAEGDVPRAPIDPRFGLREILKQPSQPRRFTDFLGGLVPRPRPTVHFLHLLLPHSPHRHLPSGHTYGSAVADFMPQDESAPFKSFSHDEETLSLVNEQRLLLQLVYTDGLLGTLLDHLQASGLYDQSLLVVTADHGLGIGPGVRPRVLDAKNRADLAWVPLFVKTPGQDAGRVDRRNEMQVDLLPTIADVLDVHVPWKLEGRSVFGAPRADSLKRWFDHPLTDDRSTTTQFAAGDWLPTVQRGYVSEVAPGAKVPRDLFAAGKDAALVGRKLSELSVGQPAPSRAVLDPVVDLEVDPATGTVPALVFGALDRPLGIEPSWLVASVNGTIAGSLAVVVNSDDKARFVGMVDDALFTAGATDLRLFTVEGQTLHQVMLAG